jgi:hypothetical protein
MKKAGIFLFTLLLGYPVLAQKTTKSSGKPIEQSPYAAVDAKALTLPGAQSYSTKSIAEYISANFTTDSDKVRAAFIWTASNIEYDAANMYALNFYEKTEDKIEKALKTRKGICENYAYVFNDICRQCGIKSFVVSGYTKQNGVAAYIPHAWCAATIHGNWYLFDPTWASGYVNNGQFTRKINNSYYRVPPARHIKSHIPFDPMWECLNYVVTNEEFYDGKTAENKTKPYFSYADTIARYEHLNEEEQLIAASARIEANGIKNAMIYDRLAHLKLEVERKKQEAENNRQNEVVDQYNSATQDFNDGVNGFNEFVNYRNKQFKPAKPDAEIRTMFDEGYNKLISARTKLSKIKNPTARIAELMITFSKSIDEAITHADEQKEWLQKYFSKGKLGRSGMFTKYTWMGIPLN